MPTKGLRQAITKAMHEADKEISGHASRGGMYAHGLASEGYSGGYRDALQDVLLALNGVRPNRRFWWNTVGGYRREVS